MNHLIVRTTFLLLAGFNTSATVVNALELEPRKLPDAKWSAQPINLQPGEQQTQNSEAESLFRTAFTLYRLGNYDDALALCTKASSLSPNDYRPRALAGYIYSAQRKLRSASQAFAEAIRLHPQMMGLYLAKAETDNLRDAQEEARVTCRKAIEVDPNYAEAHAMLGSLLRFHEERREEAISSLRTAIKLKPTLPQPYDDLGGILESAKDEKGAEEVFRQGMAADPKRMGGRFALGRLLVKQGRLVEARQLWEERTSDEDHTYPQFIELLKRAENMKRAKDTLAQNPNDPDALVDMGLAVMDGEHWIVDGRQRRALVYSRKALSIKSGLARAQYGIVKAFIQGVDGSKDEKKTLDQELAKLRKLDPALADELNEYRKTYVSGLRADPSVKFDQ